MDGVFADMEAALIERAEALFGRDVIQSGNAPGGADAETAEGDGADGDGAPALKRAVLSRRQQKLLWRHIGTVDGFWESLAEIEAGSVARLGSVAAERRWEVIFLTKRPASGGATSQVQTQRWLQAKGFAMPSVFVVQGSRGKIAAALDLHVVVDDRPENCLDVAVDSQARPVLLWRGGAEIPPAAKRLGIGAIASMAECLDILEQLDSARDEPGLLERVRRRLGLQPRTTRASAPPALGKL